MYKFSVDSSGFEKKQLLWRTRGTMLAFAAVIDRQGCEKAD